MAAGVAYHATQVVLDVHDGGPGGICLVQAGAGCRTVHASSHAMLAGVPIAWLGFLYYVWVALGAAWATKGNGRCVSFAALFLPLCGVACAASVLLGWVLLSLGALCWSCIFLYLANFVLLGAALLSPPVCVGTGMRSWPAFCTLLGTLYMRRRRLAVSPPAILGLCVAVSGIFGMRWITEGTEADSRTELDSFRGQTPHALRVGPDTPTLGNPNARATITVFVDLQCAPCGEAIDYFRGMVRDYGDQVRLCAKHFPLDRSVNPYVHRNLHQHAGLCARASVIAHRLGGFWEFHDMVRRSSRRLDRGGVLTIASELGWDRGRFAIELQRDRAAATVRADIDEAAGVGVRGTPTVFLNGRVVQRWRKPRVLHALIRYALARESPLALESPGSKRDVR